MIHKDSFVLTVAKFKNDIKLDERKIDCRNSRELCTVLGSINMEADLLQKDGIVVKKHIQQIPNTMGMK